MKKNIAVIGGSGFIGSNLIELLNNRNFKISVFDIVEPEKKYDNCTYDYLDVRNNENSYRSFTKFDFVFVLSALLGKECRNDPKNGWRTNIWGIANLIRSLTMLPDKPRLIFTSSAMVYDSLNNSVPIKESHPIATEELYEISKSVNESIIRSCCKSFNLEALVFRFFTVYGPGPATAAKGHFIPIWIDLASNNKPLTVFGDGEQTIDLTHVSDVAEALAAAVDFKMTPGSFEIFNIASGAETRVKDIATLFQQVKPDINVSYVSGNFSFPKRKFADIQKAKNLLKYNPKIHPEEGLFNFLNEKL